ncbi:MAG: hypothetical protein PHH91_01355 [Desulfuromonadaceae bacterium]|nr:hypothetical protein [Desulfuromonadaceae bacterium]
MSLQDAWIGACRSLGAVTGTVKGSLAVDDVMPSWEKQDFFSSYETSYSMTMAYPEDLLIESARAAGIPVEGREKLEIVRDMVTLQRQRDKDNEPT